MDKILDRAVSLAIIIVSIVFVGVVIHKYLIADKGSSASAAEVPLGKKLDLPDIDWEANGHTLVVALQKGCHFCNESAPFYQKLNKEMSGRQNVSIVAVLPDSVENSREHLKKLEVPFNDIRQARLKSARVSGTPTLLVADKTGTVISGWIGKLSSDKEGEVIETIIRLSRAR
ncbi:MAG: thioredoxin-like domain-containing protein [Acidobacteriota bacterium]|nr:thioredoxin-like domain-containing protein [Acidobacteriota bacterium]